MLLLGPARRYWPRQPNDRFYSTAGITLHRGEPPLGATSGHSCCREETVINMLNGR
jgi:hypothetical protein